MVIKRKDFQKAAAFLHEFLLKLHEDSECAELRDSLNLALLHMQKYYRVLQTRNQEKHLATNLSLTARGLSPMTPFVDAPDKFQYKWINLDSARLKASMAMDESMALTVLPPIIQAAKEGNTDLINELVTSDPSSTDDQDGLGRTALSYAVHFQQMEALLCLLENEANPNVSAHDGSTAIHQACHDSNSQALSMLLQYGGDFTIPDTQGRAPIHWTCTTPNLDCLQLLIQHHADVNIRDKDGLSPCMWACRLDHIEHFHHMCQADNFNVDDADGIERDLVGRTWMHWAVRRMEPLECLQTLLTTDTAAIKDEEGRTVLLTAAEMGSLAACKIILDIGGMQCIHDRDYQGRNALHLATIGGHGDVVNFLLDHSADLSTADKYNATPWDYAKNRQLHYCQLIIMSHQRQRLVSNPASPLPNGFGLMMNGSLSFYKGDFDASTDFDYASTRGSIDSMPITPPHPPKRPRTTRNVRRSRSLGSQDRDKDRINATLTSRESTMSTITGHLRREQYNSSFMSRESSMSTIDGNQRRLMNSAGDMQGRPNEGRPNERIEVSKNTRRTASHDGYINKRNGGREEVAMATDDNVYEVLEPDDDLDEVSAGGMDVSDIEDEDHMQQHNSSGPPPRRAPGHHGPRPSAPPGPQPNFQPSPPPKYAPRPPGVSTSVPHSMQPTYGRSADYQDERSSFDMPSRPVMRASNPGPGAQRGRDNFYNRSPSPNPNDTFPPTNSKPRPAPRPPRMQPAPPKPQPQPQARNTPSPVNRPGSGPNLRDLTSPPTGDQSGRDSRPDSGSRPPGMLEGKKIMPPPMLMPLENAPRPNLNRFDKPPKKKKKKRRDRGLIVEKDIERDLDVRSPPEPPENLTPPRGFAAPLHPPPSATSRPPRAQSGIPSPKYSKGAPQKHENRYVEENMDEEKDDIVIPHEKPPMVNGQALPLREGPMRSARPGKRLQPMETGEEYDMNGIVENGDGGMQTNMNEEEEVGPLIPPPQGFRGPSARPNQGRPLSQSIPQDSHSNVVRSSSAKPPLPRGRQSTSNANFRYKNPSPPRRPARPPQQSSGRNET